MNVCRGYKSVLFSYLPISYAARFGRIQFICFYSFIANTFWVYATFEGYTGYAQNDHVGGSSGYDK